MATLSTNPAPARAKTPSRYVWPIDMPDRRWIDPTPAATLDADNSWLHGLTADDRERVRSAVARCKRHGSAMVSYRVRTELGKLIWIGDRLTATSEGCEGIAWAASVDLDTGSDSIATLMPALVYLYDYQADQLLDVNPYGVRLAGSSVLSLDASPWSAILHEHDAAELPRHRRRLRRLPEGDSLPTSFRLSRPGGGYSQLTGRETVVAREPGGEPWLVLGMAQDSSDAMKLERDLLRSVLHDATTQLPNRMQFHERVEIAARHQSRHRNAAFAVIIIGLERFAMVNEGLGRAVGDQMLARVARRLEECLRDEDMLARFGGDEFAILMDDCRTREEALAIAERIRSALESPFDVGGSIVHASARVGIALSDFPGRTATSLLHEAEVALSAALQGTTPIQIYDTRMASQAAAQLHLDAELRRGLERSELLLLYQPICSLTDGAVRGFEGLIRWNHPTRGLLAPSQFLDNAGITGLIVPIGYYAIETACKQLAAWGNVPDQISISVNVDGRQFSEADLALRIAAVLARHKVDPRRLKLEVTETVIMEQSTVVAAQLDALRLLGVGVLLDDFGTGFSSLGRLRDLPIDTIKIDRVFIHRAGRDEESDEIIRAVITMARNLSIETVAEGIESHAQAEMLAREGCDAGQGFYYYPPLPAAEASRLLGKR